MKLYDFFSNIFRFRKTSLSLLAIFTYVLVIIIEEIEFKNSLTPPKHEPAILKDAWSHLEVISSTKHPFTSPYNDYLHDYLGDAVTRITNGTSYIEISSDKKQNHTIFINQHDVFNKSNDDNRIIYYESSNILVKIKGSNPKLPGILVSAHYDSVPTSFGTTDDGMGIASMLAALKYFSDSGKQPLRTIIFNFNNNEEFGLLGAEAFIQHSWFHDVSFFINLEGTGAGGRPILFRGTDKSVLDWYKYVSKPFANSIFQQGFNSGLISSQTDYHVYEKNGLRGLDIAFYLPRSFYHTFKDSIKYTSKGSLWMMITNVLDILIEVSESSDKYDSEMGYSVYFDVLNHWYFNFTLEKSFILNILLMVFIPFFIIILLSLISSKKTWFIGLRGWLRFPATLVTCYYFSKLIMAYFYNKNPLLLSVNYQYAITIVFAICVLVGYSILNVASYLAPVHDQKLVILLELNILSWLSVVWITFEINNKNNMGGYMLTIFYILSSLATIWGLLGMVFKNSPCYKKTKTFVVYGSNTPDSEVQDGDIENVEYRTNEPRVHDIVDNNSNIDSNNNSNGNNMGDESDNVLDNDENTPLMGESSMTINHETQDSFLHKIKHSAINSLQYDWMIQFLTLVPISIFLVYSNGKIVLDALHETVQENKNFDKPVWDFVILIGFSLSLFIFPFIHKLNFISVQISVILLIVGIFGSYFSPSSTENSPMKLRFVETFDVNKNESLANIFGRQGYIPEILSEVPYINEEDISCTMYNLSGTETCSYEGNRPWLLSGSLANNSFDKYLNVTVLSNSNGFVESGENDKYSPLEAVLEISLRGTRQCYMTFNTSNPKFKAPVKMVTVYKEGNDANDIAITDDYLNDNEEKGALRDEFGNWIFKVMKGIDLLEMHKLNWEDEKSKDNMNTFKVKIKWLPFLYDSDVELISNLGVNVECHWSGFDESVMVDGIEKNKVQDYLDLMLYTDVGVAWTNLRPGIVQGNFYVTI